MKDKIFSADSLHVFGCQKTLATHCHGGIEGGKEGSAIYLISQELLEVIHLAVSASKWGVWV